MASKLFLRPSYLRPGLDGHRALQGCSCRCVKRRVGVRAGSHRHGRVARRGDRKETACVIPGCGGAA